MKLLIASLLIAAVAADSFAPAWQAWKVKYDREYETEVEDAVRRGIWLDTYATVSQHNLEADMGLHTFTQIVGPFADYTEDELSAMRGSVRALDREIDFETEEEDVAPGTPSTMDWRNNNGDWVTSVKNQQQCGSCWAFSACASLESFCALKHGIKTLTSLSPQQLVSCDTKDGGCNGGTYTSAWTWLKGNGGSDTWSSYPYTSGNGRDGTCEKKNAYAQVSGYTSTTPKSENALQTAVGNQGPVSVSIDASHASFNNYNSGIYYEPNCSSTRLDHAVTCVGYNANSQGKYWIVKNSWGTSWGQSGYIWMSRDRNNNCGIATDPAYPACGSISSEQL